MKYTTVLFDLDGTLTKSEEGITKTAIYAAGKDGLHRLYTRAIQGVYRPAAV